MEPEKGISSIRIAAQIIARLSQGRLDDETTFNVGTIEGGTVRNAVAENTIVRGEFRSRNMETLDSIRLQIDEALAEVRRMYPEANIDDHGIGTTYPLEAALLQDTQHLDLRGLTHLGDLVQEQGSPIR